MENFISCAVEAVGHDDRKVLTAAGQKRFSSLQRRMTVAILSAKMNDNDEVFFVK